MVQTRKNIENSHVPLSHWSYSSMQTHSTFVNGHEESTTEATIVKNGKGHKLVSKTVNGKTQTKKLPLTRKEMENVKDRKFMPGFFQTCYDCIQPKPRTRSTRRIRKSLKK